jgi:hypothetical protein
MSLHLRSLLLLSLCAVVPIAAAADDADAPTHTINLHLGAHDNLVDWRVHHGAFYTSTGALFQNHSFATTDDAMSDSPAPLSNLSIRPFRKFLGAYFGVGWRGATRDNRVKWMADLGIVDARAPVIALNAASNIAQADADADGADVRATIRYRLSRRGTFSIQVRY